MVRRVDDLRKVLDDADLVTLAGLARRWGISRQSVHQMSMRPGFPAPVLDADGVKLYSYPDAQAYRNRHE